MCIEEKKRNMELQQRVKELEAEVIGKEGDGWYEHQRVEALEAQIAAARKRTYQTRGVLATISDRLRARLEGCIENCEHLARHEMNEMILEANSDILSPADEPAKPKRGKYDTSEVATQNHFMRAALACSRRNDAEENS